MLLCISDSRYELKHFLEGSTDSLTLYEYINVTYCKSKLACSTGGWIPLHLVNTDELPGMHFDRLQLKDLIVVTVRPCGACM